MMTIVPAELMMEATEKYGFDAACKVAGTTPFCNELLAAVPAADLSTNLAKMTTFVLTEKGQFCKVIRK